MKEIKTLYQLLVEELGKRNIEKLEIPNTITKNLNPDFGMRHYQQAAFRYFLNYWQESFDGKPRQNHQLLFHMATGSGKTLMMAGLILYLYEQGYRNFLFFVNSSNIINKTRDNFLNAQSNKYLFAEKISFSDKHVNVREVENFQIANQDDINIVFSTIQGLHMALNMPRENGITYDDFENKKIVLISDEAHHINADTKKGFIPSSQDEMFEVISWEGTVERIFKSSVDNILLEFTATVDLTNDYLAEKYKPKLIFDYPLKEFRKDGFSKEVKVLQADLPPFERALQSVLLSQYRRKIFEKNKKHIKPVILFKSKTIKESQTFFEEFKDGISILNAEIFQAIKSKTSDVALIKMFDYYDDNNITLENLVIEIKEDFADGKLISVNSKEESEAKQISINSLEDLNNEYRAVFAVDKLNEGWDVLNLFDIVRLYDTRDSKAGKIGKTTMSEAQLIGRGARYCPFQITNEQPLCGRKFDSDLENELRICEELYYHSAYNPRYIQELNTALQELGIKAKESKERKITVKDNFKNTLLYKSGHIFLNKKLPYNREDIEGLDASTFNQSYKIDFSTGYTSSSVAFEVSGIDKASLERKSKDYNLLDFGVPIVRKAIQRLDCYEFSTLKKYLPHLESIHQFITSDKYLGKIKLEISGSSENIANLSANEKLHATIQVLNSIADVIVSNKVEFKGSTRFEPFMLKDKFIDKTMNFMIDDGSEKEFGKSMNDIVETAYHLDLSTRDWYVFDDCFGTSEEKLLIKYIDKHYEALKRKYSDVYLLRNEKHFQLFNFVDGRAFEPDFVLYLVGKETVDTMHYQVFIEPKGAHLLKADEWKEDFLISIKENFKAERLFSNKEYAAWGLPFFNHEFRESEFTEAFSELLN